MSIGTLVKRKPVVIGRGASIREAARAMAENNVGLLVIVEGDRPVGVVSERDIIRGIARGVGLDEPVEKVGTFGNLLTISQDAPIYDAVKAMRERGIRHILVMDNEGKLKGVVSIRDLVEDKAIVEAWKHAWYPPPEE